MYEKMKHSTCCSGSISRKNDFWYECVVCRIVCIRSGCSNLANYTRFNYNKFIDLMFQLIEFQKIFSGWNIVVMILLCYLTFDLLLSVFTLSLPCSKSSCCDQLIWSIARITDSRFFLHHNSLHLFSTLKLFGNSFENEAFSDDALLYFKLKFF